MSEESSLDCRNKAIEVLQSIDYDSIVVITANRQTHEIRNWWYFSGHRDDWGTRELSDFAQQITSYTAEMLKSDANVAQREITIKTRKNVVKPHVGESSITLLGLGFPMSDTDAMDRLWFWCDIPKWEFGLRVSYSEGQIRESGDRHWWFTVLLGIFCFQISRKLRR